MMEEVDVVDGGVETEVHTLSDIQSYLATFNKEIGDGNVVTALSEEQLLAQGAEMQIGGNLLGNASGSGLIAGTAEQSSAATMMAQSTNQSNTSQIQLTDPSLSGGMMMGGNSGQFVQTLNQHQLANVMTQQEEPQAGPSNATQQDQLLLNTGNTYQTVTIVPTSEVNQSGEVSYVLIVSPPDEDKGAQQDLSVYDFKEEKGGDIECEDDDVDGGSSQAGMSGAQQKSNAAVRRSLPQPMQQLMCNYCNYTSPKRYLLTRHMKTHSEERPHKCNICDRGFKTVASLQNHINTHTGVKPHKCKECDASFTTSGELVRHVRYRHTFEKPHKCSECDYASVELSKLKRHMRSHSGERPYKCPHCSYSSPDTFKLKRHLRIHTGEKPYECDICHARFTQSNSLKAHRQIHTGEKPVYQCELCPTTCGRKTDLKIHVQKLHTSEKPIQCKKCGKAFPDRYTYKIHLKSHDGEKCFKCELCPYAALSQRHLESHILTHTGEKPFQCDKCDMSFRQKQLLKRHKNIYHTLEYIPPVSKDKKHKCVECGKAFAHRGNLLRHMVHHDPDNPLYQEMALKADAEDAAEGLNGGVVLAEEDEEGIEEGEVSDEDVSYSTANNPMQVELVNLGQDAEQQGNIFVQHQGIVYSLQMPDHSNPDGTIPVGEPNTDISIASGREIIKVEEGAPENRISYTGNIMKGSHLEITEGETGSIQGNQMVLHTSVESAQNLVNSAIANQQAAANAFGFATSEEDGIQPGEH